MLVNQIDVHYNYLSTLTCPYSSTSSRDFQNHRTKKFKKVNVLDSLPVKPFWEDDMAFADSLRHFPIVKVIPLKAFDAEKERPGEAALRGMVVNALVSFDRY